MKRKAWTKGESALLSRSYPKIGAIGVARKPGRDPPPVTAKARSLWREVSARMGTILPSSLRLLKRRYAESGAVALGEKMGRSPASVALKAMKMGLHRTLRDRATFRPVTMTPVNLAYLAGLIDGEGTVTLKRTGGTAKKNLLPIVIVVNTSEEIISWLRGQIATPNALIAFRRYAPGARLWSFSIRGLNYLPLYKALIPYLTLKRPQMELLVEWTSLRLSQHRDTKPAERALLLSRMIRFMNLRPSVLSPAEKAEDDWFNQTRAGVYEANGFVTSNRGTPVLNE